ncbi:hypothetical protein ABFS82_04G112700 [Erythranthe guttata]|uniref:Protein kinase domain-containing protein n=1 Tax=Erythranthe guttata TaxID=4155 RepID=A0A022QDK8_ERYGU|nr:PREDICTED: mitogen-activated protein kinase kinase kinase 3-like [Erythranthe guttata]EYU24575.1 hypothetical protein MIMGU_mgv1a008079mg [Erythranthe guttata]|eukprot:XP_012852640.1 PREDICTED: mitogen-activated protein kinase kinase kinase 3-like [Erythranthe guttata]
MANEYGDGVSWYRGSMIGKGSFGRVYLATLKKPRSKYSYYPSLMAVKSAEVSASGSIQNEREVLNAVKGCPNIIKCFGDETTTGQNGAVVYNLLLEYGSAGTLAEKIKNSNAGGGGGLSEFEVKRFTKSILTGLNHIHVSGYVHCDIKPDNILLFSDFRAKIADFGLSKRVAVKQSKKRKLMEPYWRGTPMYLSPEAVIDKIQDPPSDIWALGCIVLEMLTGKPVWEDEKKELTNDEIIAKIGAGRELPKIPIGVSKEARDFLKGCFVRKSMFRLTAEMLLNHPFVEGVEIFDDDDDVADDEEEEEEVEEDLSEIDSVLLVSESDCGVSSCSDDYSFYYLSDENEEENGEDEISSSVCEETKVSTQVLSESRERFPVSFTVPSAV